MARSIAIWRNVPVNMPIHMPCRVEKTQTLLLIKIYIVANVKIEA